MSIETEINRISTNVSDTLSAVSEMGGEVPEGATSNNMAAGVRSIPVGAKIDDTTPSATTTYSSSKIESEISKLNEANAAQNTEIAKKANDAELAAVAKSGSYDDLTNKPTIPPVPSALPNPNKLKLTGAVTAEYDGSSEVSVEIPSVGGGTDFTPFIEDAAADVKQVGNGPDKNLQISFSKNASEALIVISSDMVMAYSYFEIIAMFPNGKTSHCGEYRGGNKKYAWIRVTRDMWHKWGSMYLPWATYGAAGGWSSCSVAHSNNTVATKDQPVLAGVRIGPFNTIPSTIAVYIKEG